MRRTLLVPLLLAACGTAAPANTDADERAIREASAAYARAWNARDTAAVLALIAPDAVAIDDDGSLVGDRAAIAAMNARVLAATPPGLAFAFTTAYVRWLAPGAAIAGGTFEITGAPAGMPTRGAWMQTFKKVDGTWLGAGGMSAPIAASATPPPMASDTGKAVR